NRPPCSRLIRRKSTDSSRCNIPPAHLMTASLAVAITRPAPRVDTRQPYRNGFDGGCKFCDSNKSGPPGRRSYRFSRTRLTVGAGIRKGKVEDIVVFAAVQYVNNLFGQLYADFFLRF